MGGYQARQAIETAIVHAEEEGGYDWLIYLTSQNDFIEGDADSTNIARTVLEELAPLRDRFPRGIVLMVMPYMEYSLNDILGQYGWTGGAFDQSEALFEQLPMMTERLGIAYIDLAEMVNGLAVKSGSVFARLALWVDHCHMSPTANRWAAEKLEKLIRR